MVWPKSAPTRAAAATLLPLLAAGMLARLSLAESLRASGELMCSTIDAVSGEVGPAGRLAAATGKLTSKMSVDAGMYSVVLPMHQLSPRRYISCLLRLPACLQLAMAHSDSARWEVDVYRPTYIFPHLPFMQLGVIARSMVRCGLKPLKSTCFLHRAVCEALQRACYLVCNRALL